MTTDIEKKKDVWCKFYIDVTKCTDILNQLVETYFPSKSIFKKTQNLICIMLQILNKMNIMIVKLNLIGRKDKNKEGN